NRAEEIRHARGVRIFQKAGFLVIKRLEDVTPLNELRGADCMGRVGGDEPEQDDDACNNSGHVVTSARIGAFSSALNQITGGCVGPNVRSAPEIVPDILRAAYNAGLVLRVAHLEPERFPQLVITIETSDGIRQANFIAGGGDILVRGAERRESGDAAIVGFCRLLVSAGGREKQTWHNDYKSFHADAFTKDRKRTRLKSSHLQ